MFEQLGKMPEDKELLIMNKIKVATVGNTYFKNLVGVVSKMQVDNFKCEISAIRAEMSEV